MKIPRGACDEETVRPAWLPIQTGTAPDSAMGKPLIRCACGKLVGLGLHHVHADGRVTASFYHYWPTLPEGYEQGCWFHEYLELEGWDGGEFPPRATP